jgi:hypothetical protein
VNVLAVSDFIRTLFIILIVTPVIMLWGAAVIDVIRRRLSGWSVVGWLVLILVLPIVGPLVYFAVRPPAGDDAEQAYLAARDVQRERAAHSVESTGYVP